MNKTELESKHIAELHALAAEAGVPRYRMLRREDLIEALVDGKAAAGGRENERGSERRERPPRQHRERPARDRAPRDRAPKKPQERKAAPEPAGAEPPAPEPAVKEPVARPAAVTDAEPESSRPRRKRRRRRFGRKSKGLRVQDLLTPPPGRQALVYGESRAACTTLLREIAGELSSASDGPDPIALLIDPSPEELADWRREAPEAEIVAAGQTRHASDALAQAARRAETGEDVILLVDSLSRLDDTEAAKEIFDSGLGFATASGSLTVVAALERQS